MRKQNILPNRRPHNPRILRRIGHRARPPQDHAPIRPIHIANDRAQKTGLTRADAAHDPDELAFPDCEVYAFEGGGERFGGSGPGEFAVFDGEDLVSGMLIWCEWEVGWIVWNLRKCGDLLLHQLKGQACIRLCAHHVAAPQNQRNSADVGRRPSPRSSSKSKGILI